MADNILSFEAGKQLAEEKQELAQRHAQQTRGPKNRVSDFIATVFELQDRIRALEVSHAELALKVAEQENYITDLQQSEARLQHIIDCIADALHSI